MIRLLCTFFIAACSLFLPALRGQQTSGENLTFASVDSFLVKRDYTGARERLMIIQRAPVNLSRPSEFTPGIIQEYLGALNRLQAIPGLPDSITIPLAENAAAFTERFSEVNAGVPAHHFYDEYHRLLWELHYSMAYERFTLAEFLRHLFVTRERERLLSNLDRTREYVKAHKFPEAELQIKNFRGEKLPMALAQMNDTLAQKYDALAEQLHTDKVTVAYESGRQPISKTVYLEVGIGLIPSVTAAYKDMVFLNPVGNQEVSVTAEGYAFSFTTIGLSAEAGYFITPSLAAGISYFRSTTLRENSLIGGGRSIRFKATFLYQMINVFFKWLFDQRTGLRPYFSLVAGYVQGKLIPERYPDDQQALLLKEIAEGGPQFGGGFGVDFVFSSEFPLSLSSFVTAIFNGADGVKILKGSQFLIGVKVGYLF